MNSSDTQRIKEYTDELTELVKGVTMKVQKVRQAKALVSSVETKMADKFCGEERRKIKKAVERLEEATYTGVGEEMNKLKEIITLLEAEHGKR